MSQYQPPQRNYDQSQWQQPGYPQGYPQYQQPPMQPMPPQKPQRKPVPRAAKIGCTAAAVLVVALIGIIIAVGGSGSASPNASDQSSGAATQPANQPTQAPGHWTTTHTFTGNGIKKTPVFTVGNDWKIVWSCDPSSFYGGQYNVIVSVTGSDGTPLDVAVNTICQKGNTSDLTEEHQGGDVYLDVNSEGAWTIQVQELK